MNPKQLAEEIERLVIDTTEKFGQSVEGLQGTLYNKLLAVLKDLEIDSEGYIKQTAENRNILFYAENIINEYLPGDRLTSIISNSVSVIPNIDNFNVNYFSSIFDNFNPNRNFAKSLQKATIENIEANLLNDGLTAQIKNPLSDILNQNINSGGNFSGFLKQVRDFVEGNDQVEGRVLSYSRTYLRDALFDYSRAFQQSLTNDLKLEFYLYAGGLIDSSRDFCKEHAGEYYHHKEIEKLANQSWQGKRAGTTSSSIFIYAGGYSCSHSIIPVSTKIVPEDVIERARKKGYIK